MEASALTHASRRGLLARRSPLLKLQGDEKLIAMARAGNPGAFEAIVDRYQGRLLGFCRQMLGSTEDAEDVLQEVFVNAYKAMLADEREINLRPWLYRIARNRCLNYLRKPTADAQESMDMVPEVDAASTAERVHNREEFRQILSDVNKLPETQRTALLLREMDALSYEEIAAAMDTTVPSVKSLLVRARISLAEASQARLLTCGEVRVELSEAAEGLRKVSAPVRRHVRECEECADFRSQVRSNEKALAALAPIGLLAAFKGFVLGKLGFGGASAGGASATAGGAGAAAGGASAGAGAASAGAAAAGAASAATAAIGGGGAAGGIGAIGGAIGTKAVAGVVTAAVLTAGAAVEVKQHSSAPVTEQPRAKVADFDPQPASPQLIVAKPAAEASKVNTAVEAPVTEPVEPTPVPAVPVASEDEAAAAEDETAEGAGQSATAEGVGSDGSGGITAATPSEGETAGAQGKGGTVVVTVGGEEEPPAPAPTPPPAIPVLPPPPVTIPIATPPAEEETASEEAGAPAEEEATATPPAGEVVATEPEKPGVDEGEEAG
ncbi:MAG: RNA polymerase sigma factor [Solirubrobacterales bacterium]